MSQGRVEQIGSPYEIYKTPATEFVASFVGQLNLIPVKILNLAERLVQLNGYTLKAGRLAEKFSPISPCLAIRPEEINPGQMEGQNNLQGVVESIHYLGSIVRIRVDVHGSFFLIDIFNDQKLAIPRVGSSYDFYFPVEACWLI
jgi:putative spermidine/putrescine transport system ATP-binding protein